MFQALLLEDAQMWMALDNTVLAIQGLPGTGKTFTGARMICQSIKEFVVSGSALKVVVGGVQSCAIGALCPFSGR